MAVSDACLIDSDLWSLCLDCWDYGESDYNLVEGVAESYEKADEVPGDDGATTAEQGRAAVVIVP